MLGEQKLVPAGVKTRVHPESTIIFYRSCLEIRRTIALRRITGDCEMLSGNSLSRRLSTSFRDLRGRVINSATARILEAHGREKRIDSPRSHWRLERSSITSIGTD